MFYCPEKFAKNPAAELNPQSKKKSLLQAWRYYTLFRILNCFDKS